MPGEMQEYEVVLTWEAIYDVTDIADYIEAEFGQGRADRFQEDIKKEMEKQEVHVLRVLREERNWQNILEKTKSYTYPT